MKVIIILFLTIQSIYGAEITPPKPLRVNLVDPIPPFLAQKSILNTILKNPDNAVVDAPMHPVIISNTNDNSNTITNTNTIIDGKLIVSNDRPMLIKVLKGDNSAIITKTNGDTRVNIVTNVNGVPTTIITTNNNNKNGQSVTNTNNNFVGFGDSGTNTIITNNNGNLNGKTILSNGNSFGFGTGSFVINNN